mmetsp:Transcript_4243/g.7279  ORF Transcript_4243/g.7279 Transcript_4243/m.7279 type:complete len:113 (+) Transcript_4243:1101-1439(+)
MWTTLLDEDILTLDYRFLLFAIPSIKSLFKIVYQAQHTNIAPILYQTICSSKQGQNTILTIVIPIIISPKNLPQEMNLKCNSLKPVSPSLNGELNNVLLVPLFLALHAHSLH